MGCNCRKKRNAVSYTAKAYPDTVKDDSQPTKQEFPNGEIRTYSTRLEALAAQAVVGGGRILP